MSNYSIFVDSSADLDQQFVKGNDIHIVAMSYTLGNEDRDCTKMEEEDVLKRFYDGQRNGDITHTSQVSPQQYLDAFDPVLAAGKDILYISLSGGLTNSHDSIHLAKLELHERYPKADVYAIDSLCATSGIGLLAELAVKNRNNGMTVAENALNIEKMKHHVCHLFMVEDLLYLKRGGRIPAATAVIGTALSVKPILVIDEQGKLRVVDKKRGRKHAAEEMLERYKCSRDPESHRITIVHADAPGLASILAEGVKEIDRQADIAVWLLSPIIGAHTGPGMAALIYFGNRTEITQ